jgi:hypothetical protein
MVIDGKALYRIPVTQLSSFSETRARLFMTESRKANMTMYILSVYYESSSILECG